MLSLGLSSAGRNSGSSGNGGGAGNDAESTASTSSSGLLGGTVDGRATTPASSTSASSSRARSRSPGSNSSPRFHRRTTGTGINRMDSPSQLPTIMSASNIHASNPEAMDINQGAQYSSSPRSGQGFYINGSSETGPKSRSSSLAMAGSAPRNISGATLPEPIGSGSPREGSRLYERGSASGSFTAASSLNSVFSSSFPSSGGIWSKEATTGNSNAGFNSAMPPPTSANPTRSSLSRHVSLSGAMPKTAIGLGNGTPPMRSSSNPAGWPESPMSVEDVALASSGDHRQGRSLTRGGYAGGNGSVTTRHQEQQGAGGAGNHLARSLSIASDRASNASQGNSGIAISNMSPFVRDLRGLPPVPQPAVGQPRVPGAGPTTAHPYSSSFTTANDYYSRGPATGVGSTFGVSPSSLAAGERARPSLHGAVGSGRTSSMAPPLHRNRRESFWGDERPLREGDEDAYGYDDEDSDDDYAPPTRSGATSRRHSVAAFTSTSTLTALTSPPAMRSQIGFQVPSQSKPAAPRPTNGGGNNGANTSIQTQQAQKSSELFSSGGSRLDDEDLLATNLSSALQLNLEAHAAKQQRDEEEQDQQTGLHMRPTGLDSRASSMPVAVGAHFGFGSPPTQRQMVFGSVQPEQRGGLVSTSPSRAVSSGAGSAQDRRSSTSGDPYSPSANVARYLATAHHGQQPSQPSHQGGASPASMQHQLPHHRDLGTSPHGEGGLWPPSGTNVFAQHQQSPAFRGGTLPPPDMLPHFPSHNGPVGHIAATYGGLQSLPPNAPSFGGRGPSPTGPMQQHGPGNAISPQPPSSFLPPFAGFSSAPRIAGPPPPALSPMNASAQPYFVPPIAPQPNLNDLGRGVPLHALPAGGPLYIVEFKAGRTDLFYVEDPDQLTLKKGDLVVVEADRGKDLGKCLTSCTLDEVRDFQMHQVESALGQLAANAGGGATIGGIGTLPPGQQPSAAAIARMTKEIHPKKIYGRASPADVALLAVKAGDEQKALNVCRAKVLQHQLPMEVTDAEFQFDRRRLTFFYIADRRIDFRSLVKDLFRLYKTRIWLCAIDNGVLQR